MYLKQKCNGKPKQGINYELPWIFLKKIQERNFIKNILTQNLKKKREKKLGRKGLLVGPKSPPIVFLVLDKSI